MGPCACRSWSTSQTWEPGWLSFTVRFDRADVWSFWDVDWATVSWHSLQPARMQQVLRTWDEHLAHPSLPRTLSPALNEAGFDEVEMVAHSFASADFDPETYGVALAPVISGYVAGRGGIGEPEAGAWAIEQQELGARGEYFFACTQFCFKATRPR